MTTLPTPAIRRLLLVAAITCFHALPATASGLVSHKAAYTLTLDRGGSAPDVAGAQGRVIFDWRNACAGWTSEYRSVLEVAYAGAEPVRLGVASTTWESNEGTDYRFSVTHRLNGKTTDRFAGNATLSGPGQKGRVVYSRPRGRKPVLLNEGTMFPLLHMRAILAKALNAKRFPVIFSTALFDGMDEEDVFTATTVITEAGKQPAVRDNGLAGLRSWMISVAYFRDSAKTDAPYYEYGIRLYENGVADELSISLDDMRLKGKLAKLDLVDAPDCGGIRP